MSSFAPFDDARSLLLAANLVPTANIHFPNEPFRPPNPPAIWLSVEAYSDVLDPIDIGANAWEERGTIVVYCIAPFGTGTDSLRQLAKNVANTFRGLGPRNPFYGNASIGAGNASDDGIAYVIPVTIAFTYQDITV